MVKKRVGYAAIVFGLIVNLAWASEDGMAVFKKYRDQEKKMDSAAKTMVMVQSMSGEGMESDITIYKKGDKTRIETLIKKSPYPEMGKPGMKNIVIDDGRTSWIFSPVAGRTQHTAEKEESEEPMPAKVEYIKKENVSGLECHKIKCTYKDGNVDTLWIDTKSSWLVKSESAEEGESEVTVNSDFRDVEGIFLPWKMTIEGEGMVQTIAMKSLKINTDIDDSLFDPNKVEGYKEASADYKQAQEVNKNLEDVMVMAAEIQRLYQNGETEKAEALQKKLEQMMSQQQN